MNRKLIGLLAVVGLITLAGCVGPTADTPSPTDTAGSTDTVADTGTVQDYSFTKVDASETPDEAKIVDVRESGDTTKVVVEGTVTVSDGCKTIVVGSEPELEDYQIKTMIGTQDTGGDMCTQALKPVGYTLEVTYTGNAQEIQVAHAGTDSATHTLSIADFVDTETEK